MSTRSRAQLATMATGVLVTLGTGAVEAEAGILRFQPVADAHVSEAKRKANFGGSKRLLVDGSPVVRSYLRFNVRGLGGAVSYATLQLSVMRTSTGGLLVRRAGANHWGEQSIRFANAPRFRSAPTARSRAVKAYRTANISVTKLIRGNGVVTLVVASRGRGAASIFSSEGPRILRPQLVVGVNSAPSCLALQLATLEDTPGTIGPVCTDLESEPMSYRIVGQGTLGTASVVAGKLRYVPKDDVNGPDRFFYQARDKKKWSKAVPVTVDIRKVNDPPTCANRSLPVDEDAGDAVGTQCSDVDGDPLSYSITTAPQRGSAFVVGGELRYVPVANTNGPDSFSYRARDASLPSTPATVSVNVRPVNDAPTCANVGLSTAEDVAGELDPACSDIDGDALAYGIAVQGILGSASVVGGRLRYAPFSNVIGGDQFAYYAFDGAAASAPATAGVAITPVNDAPVCQPTLLETPEEEPGQVNPNCTDAENDPMTYFISSQGTKGTATVAAGLLRYVPQANQTGPDSFTYGAQDSSSASSAPASVSVSIGEFNDPPVCFNVALPINEDVTGERDPDCSDIEQAALTYAIVTQGSKGTASVVAGKLRYVPSANANGADSFTYRASDGGKLSVSATVSVSIASVNDVPVCANVGLTINEDVTGERDPSCTDADGDPLTYQIATSAGKGIASVVASKLRFAPNANANGADSFTYRALDGASVSPSATVSVTINPVNDAPVCANVGLTTNEDTTGEQDPSCADVDGDVLTYQIVAQGTRGTASVVANKLRYVPNANANGADSFTYRATDAALTSSAATAAVTITPVNDAPTCANVPLATDEDVTGERNPSCADIDGDALTYGIVSQGTKGIASVVTAKLRYVPNPNANGPDSFTYRASDGIVQSAAATTSVSIVAVNDTPSCANVSLTTNEDTTGEQNPSCADIDGDTLTYSIASQGTKGTASVVGGKLRYVPATNLNGQDSFSYRASDGVDLSPAASVSVTITAVNDAPVCSPVPMVIDEDGTGTENPNCTDIESPSTSLAYSIVSQPTQGTASVVAQQLRYVPNPNFTGSDSFTYGASDGVAQSAPAQVTVTIGAVNDPPTCQPRTLTVDEDAAQGNVAPLCTDPESDPMTFEIVATPSKGTASIVTGSIRYVPNANATGPDTFTYRARDPSLAGLPAPVNVRINPINDAPTCANVPLTTNEDTTGERDPGCTDVDGDALVYDVVSQGAKGTASIAAGKLRYVPNANANGADSFTYNASDGALTSGTATVSVSITAVNDAPVCAPVTLATSEDTQGETNPDCSDVDSVTLTYSIVTPGTKGTASVVAAKLRYVPNLNANGPDSFTYRANDGAANSAPAAVSVTVHPVNDAPACVGVNLATDEDVMGETDPVCTDVEGDALTYAIVGQGVKGTASVVAGKLRYIPNPNANGADSFTYRASDGTLASPAANASVSITPINDAPTCASVSLATNEDVPAERDPSCTDVDGDVLMYSIASQGTKGTASVVAGKLRYVPSANVNGPDSFTYRASDGPATSNAATVSVTIAPANDAPTCANVTLATSEDATGEQDPSCTDVDGDPLTYSIASQGTKGTASIALGKLHYVPDADANGADTFTYRAHDPATQSAAATASVTIAAVNDAPVAADQSASTPEDTAKGLTLGASDVDGNPLIFTIVSQPAHGTLSGSGASRTYTPAANYHGPDSFTFKANDGAADSNVATVTLSVGSVNDPPVAVDQSASTAEDSAKALTLGASDVDGNPLSFTIVSQPAHGTLSPGTGATRTYTPAANYHGPDSFTFKANDGAADSNVATVTLSVGSVNDPPVAVDQSASTAEDTAKALTLGAIDVDGNPLSFTIVSQPGHGALSGTGASQTYTPDANYHGPDSFTFKANDATADSNVATVSLTINPANDAPSCADVPLATNEDVVGERDPSCTDVDGDTLTYSVVDPATKGTASVVAGKLRYVPNTNTNGVDSFTYRADDGPAESAPATVTVTVAAVNDPPVCADLSLNTAEDTPGERDPSCTDIDGGALTYSIVGQGGKGTASLVAGKLHYAPNANANGIDSFTYRANDGAADGTHAMVTVTIQPANDAPVCAGGAFTADEDGALSETACSDADGDSLTLTTPTAPSHGELTPSPDGGFDYAPHENYHGPDSFAVTAEDPNGLTSGAPVTITITVAAVNDAPTCNPVTLTTPVNVPGTAPANCADVDGDSLTYEIVTPPANGTASVVLDQLGYAPALGYSGPDLFTYRAWDGTVFSPPADVAVTVTP